MGCKDAKYIELFVQLAGACHGGPDRKHLVVETDVELAEPKHPVLTGIEPFKVKEEFYYQLKVAKPADNVKPLLLANIEGKKEMVCWAFERSDGGRSFGFSGLHFHDNWKRPDYRRLVAQATLWTLKLPIPEKGLAVDLVDKDLKLK
jgi:type 1 glutamine amidotransferase